MTSSQNQFIAKFRFCAILVVMGTQLLTVIFLMHPQPPASLQKRTKTRLGLSEGGANTWSEVLPLTWRRRDITKGSLHPKTDITASRLLTLDATLE